MTDQTSNKKKISTELVGILDANMIYWEFKGNNNTHMRVYDEEKGIFWNIYFPSLKFHQDGQSTEGTGTKKFLSKFDLSIVDKNMVGIQQVCQNCFIDKISDYQIGVTTSSAGDILLIPFNIDFSIVMLDSKNYYTIKQMGDGWLLNTNAPFVITSSSKIFVSSEAGVNWGGDKQKMDDSYEEEDFLA